MAQTLAVMAGEAGPSAFHSSEDFIAFDDGEESGEAAGAEEESAPASPGPHRNGSSRGRNGATVAKTNGKKRKVNEVAGDGEGKSKRDQRRELARGTPWCVDVDFERCLTPTDVLHDELMAFADWISPTIREHETRKMVIQLIRKAIQSQWSDAEVHAFGSQNTQLYMPQGDIDLVVVSARMDDQRREGVLRSMAACLRRNNLATDVQVIARAKVPIIKFVCTHGKYKVDISVNQTNGIDASHFVQDWLHKMPALRPLIMATKLLLSQRGMSEVFSGGLGSYSVICLVISHLQMHPKVQRGEIDPSCNLGVLFLEFLELFGKNFGYDEVGISIAGRGRYFRKAGRGWKDDRRPYMLSIEDPGDASNDISKGSFSILNVRQTFGGAFDIMTAVMCQREREATDRADKRSSRKQKNVDEDEQAREALVSSARLGESDKDPDSLLGHIVGVNREMLKARKDIDRLWESGTLQYKLGRSPPGRDPVPMGPPSRAKERDMRQSVKGSTVAERVDGPRHREVNGSAVQASGADRRRDANKKVWSASEPIVVVDESDNRRGRKWNEERRRPHATLPLDPEPSPGHERGEEETEAVDTRYASTNGHMHKRASRLDEFAKLAPTTFVIDDSASDDDQGADESVEEGEVAETPPKRRRTADSTAKRTQRERHEYWGNKGNAVGAMFMGDDSSDEESTALHVYQ